MEPKERASWGESNATAEARESLQADSSEHTSETGKAGELNTDGDNRTTKIAEALELQDRGQLQAASDAFKSLLLNDPTDVEVLFHTANAEASLGNLDHAIDLLAEIPADHPEAGMPSLGVSADWCFKLGRFADAETRYRAILTLDSSINVARRNLAFLLNRQGRRHEAAALIRELCLSGDVMQDELHALIVESDAIYDAPGTRSVSGERVYTPIGTMGEARHLFTEKKYAEAANLLAPLVQSGEAPAAAIALMGRAIIESQDDEDLIDWIAMVDESVIKLPEYWAAMGAYLIREAKYQEGVRALAEAIRLDPTDLLSIRRMFQGLRSTGKPDQAEVWIERYALMNRILKTSNAIASGEGTNELYATLADALEEVGRNLEAVFWKSIAATKTNDQERLTELQKDLKSILKNETAFASLDRRWCGMELGDRDLPEFPVKAAQIAANAKKKTPSIPEVTQAVFTDASATLGLEHRYEIAENVNQKGFSIYQTFGGGVAIIDFDLDGRQDIYLAQGSADPPRFKALKSDSLYRHASNDQLVNVTAVSGTTEAAYTIGVTSGDWNQDGFPDLAIGNIGVNVLLINQGDGTFQRTPLDHSEDLTRLSTSLAIADLTGDHLPDLFSVSYIQDDKIAQKPSTDDNGNVKDALPPLSFQATRDQLYVCQKDGSWKIETIGSNELDGCTGLGIVVSDILPEQEGNEAFVANDVRNNQLWNFHRSATGVDYAVASGCAYGSIGSATASMGIAAGDADRNGDLDLHVTNFSGQAVSMYLSQEGFFRDLNIRSRLALGSTPYVGFGTQMLDYANNGWLDLLVVNGHVEDLSHHRHEFRQPSQIFENRGGQFSWVDVKGDEYWNTPHLGRAVATLDFDRDGLLDFIATDMLEATRLFLNGSPDSGHWIAFQLVGRESERDAIGAKIELQAGSQTWTDWVTAGDGFLCKNESPVHFGIGVETEIDRVNVTWPSGLQQSFDAAIDQSWLLVEDTPDAFSLAH